MISNRLKNAVSALSLILILLAGSFLPGCSTPSGIPSGTDPTVVVTDQGAVRGVFRNGALEFRGIPYAESTAGEFRWTLPRPRTPWKGIRDASKFGSACPQVARYHLTEGSSDEDCLFLNVSIPEKAAGKSEKLPVFVWIHGGAFVGGGSNLYRLDAMAREGGLIVVSLNYRLGALGFLAHPSFEPKVFGLEDQRAALRWVKTNIAAFGGDPEKITVGGESAGAGSTCAHVASPELVKGLFSKAIIQSAACTSALPTREEASGTALHLASHPKVNCTDPKTALECLRHAPLQGILDAQTEISTKELLGFAIFTHNDTLPAAPADAFRTGKIARVPILMGGTRDELRLYVGYDVQAGAKITPETFPLALKKMYGQTALEIKRNAPARILKEYALKSGDVPAERLGTIMSDYIPTPGINNCMYLKAATLASRVTPVYQFEFADEDAPVLGVGIAAKPDPGFKMGAVHSSELNYLFPKLDNTSNINAPDLSPSSQALADRMISYWSNFVKTGVPAASGLPAWPRFKNPKSTLLLEPRAIRTYDASRAHHCGFWKKLYPEVLGNH
jgi:para-nitrobenzyl esterase